MKIESLEKLLEDQLKDLYNAENQLIKALPKMVKAASSEELRENKSANISWPDSGESVAQGSRYRYCRIGK